MTVQQAQNGQTFGTIRGIWNSNDEWLDANKANVTQVLLKTNTVPYTPTADYHPAPKLYVDGLFTSWHSVYNPQALNADIFSRPNHTGMQGADTITQDSDHRFVSDAEKTLWNSKEDAIGTKNTAFNKDFGTGTGQVAEGNHSHTKNDIGLGNVDNTSDVNKPISTAQQTELDLKVDKDGVETLVFDIPISKPAHEEGLLFYCADFKCLAFYNEITDFTLNIGQEQVTRVINKTGVTIANGTPVRQSGIDGGTGLPMVVEAQSDTYDNSYVIGLTTHDLVNGVPGLITSAGRVNELDTSSFSSGDILYLDSSTPGAVTTTAPPIATRIGSVLVSHATTGAILANIQTAIKPPGIIGIIQGNTGTYTVTTTVQEITGYSNSISVGVNTNVTNGTIEIPTTFGYYRASITAGMSFTSSASGTRTITIEVYDQGHAAIVCSYDVSIPKDSASRTASFNWPFEVSAVHDYVLRIKADSTISNLTFDHLNFDIESIHL